MFLLEDRGSWIRKLAGRDRWERPFVDRLTLRRRVAASLVEVEVGVSGGSVNQVRIVTWNVWWRFGPCWRERQHGLLETLRAVDPDVVALQESWGRDTMSQAQEFGDQLGMVAAFAAPSLPPPPDPVENPDQAGVEVGLGLLSRWPIRRLQQVSLPARHRTPAPVAITATLDHPSGPLHVVIACLEWEPAYNDDRIAQAQALVKLATDPATDGALPVIVCGDLNAAPDSPVLRPLQDALIDAWAAGGGDPSAATLRSDHPFAPAEADELIDQRIDHVFIRPGRPGVRVAVESVAITGDAVDGLAPSDHKAVVCDLSWTTTT